MLNINAAKRISTAAYNVWTRRRSTLQKGREGRRAKTFRREYFIEGGGCIYSMDPRSPELYCSLVVNERREVLCDGGFLVFCGFYDCGSIPSRCYSDARVIVPD